DVAPRRGGLDLVPSARLGWTSFGRAHFGRLVPLARLADLGRRHLARGFDELTRRFGLHLADRLFEREALAGDVGLLERRRHSPYLPHHPPPPPLLTPPPPLALAL